MASSYRVEGAPTLDMLSMDVGTIATMLAQLAPHDRARAHEGYVFARNTAHEACLGVLATLGDMRGQEDFDWSGASVASTNLDISQQARAMYRMAHVGQIGTLAYESTMCVLANANVVNLARIVPNEQFHAWRKARYHLYSNLRTLRVASVMAHMAQSASPISDAIARYKRHVADLIKCGVDVGFGASTDVLSTIANAAFGRHRSLIVRTTLSLFTVHPSLLPTWPMPLVDDDVAQLEWSALPLTLLCLVPGLEHTPAADDVPGMPNTMQLILAAASAQVEPHAMRPLLIDGMESVCQAHDVYEVDEDADAPHPDDAAQPASTRDALMRAQLLRAMALIPAPLPEESAFEVNPLRNHTDTSSSHTRSQWDPTIADDARTDANVNVRYCHSSMSNLLEAFSRRAFLATEREEQERLTSNRAFGPSASMNESIHPVEAVRRETSTACNDVSLLHQLIAAMDVYGNAAAGITCLALNVLGMCTQYTVGVQRRMRILAWLKDRRRCYRAWCHDVTTADVIDVVCRAAMMAEGATDRAVWELSGDDQARVDDEALQQHTAVLTSADAHVEVYDATMCTAPPGIFSDCVEMLLSDVFRDRAATYASVSNPRAVNEQYRVDEIARAKQFNARRVNWDLVSARAQRALAAVALELGALAQKPDFLFVDGVLGAADRAVAATAEETAFACTVRAACVAGALECVDGAWWEAADPVIVLELETHDREMRLATQGWTRTGVLDLYAREYSEMWHARLRILQRLSVSFMAPRRVPDASKRYPILLGRLDAVFLLPGASPSDGVAKARAAIRMAGETHLALHEHRFQGEELRRVKASYETLAARLQFTTMATSFAPAIILSNMSQVFAARAYRLTPEQASKVHTRTLAATNGFELSEVRIMRREFQFDAADRDARDDLLYTITEVCAHFESYTSSLQRVRLMQLPAGDAQGDFARAWVRPDLRADATESTKLQAAEFFRARHETLRLLREANERHDELARMRAERQEQSDRRVHAPAHERSDAEEASSRMFKRLHI